MIIFVANASHGLTHYLAGKNPGSVGRLISPGDFREPVDYLPYVIDNGAYSAFQNNTQWNEESFFRLLDRCQLSRYKPNWIVVPDKVGDRNTTISLWKQYENPLRKYKTKLAFAVQDGMTLKDVPESADVVFLGGSTEWKWRNAGLFVAQFPSVHVGRVNWWDKIEYCERIGVESIDGTGFFRAGTESIQAQQLRDFVEGIRRTNDQQDLFLHAL